MSEVPARLEEFLNREAHEQYPATVAATMHEYAAAALERPDRDVVVEDFRSRHGAFLLARSFASERAGGQPDGLHVVPVYDADTSETGYFGKDFYPVIGEPETYNPDGVSYSVFLAQKLKADPGLKKVYDSQMQTMNMIRASKGEKPLTEEEFDAVLCPPENPFGRRYLSVGLVADAMTHVDEGNNLNRVWGNATPEYVGLLLTASDAEIASANSDNIATLREQLMTGLRTFKAKAPEAFAEYWEQVTLALPTVPRLDTRAQSTLPSID